MPNRQTSTGGTNGPTERENFRQRYDDIEKRRGALVARLNRLSAVTEAHPGHKRALKLLNETFRKAKLAQRLAVLQSAAWLIEVLERIAISL